MMLSFSSDVQLTFILTVLRVEYWYIQKLILLQSEASLYLRIRYVPMTGLYGTIH